MIVVFIVFGFVLGLLGVPMWAIFFAGVMLAIVTSN